jgi:ribosomal protein S18 acetylase RimI-like enzyme
VIYYQNEKIGYFRLARCDCGIYKIGADISPVFQGKGFGYHSYLNFAKDILRPMNINYLSLRVKKENITAMKLYSKLGFQIVNNVEQNTDEDVMITTVEKILLLPS